MSHASRLREALNAGGPGTKEKGPPVADGILSVTPDTPEALEWRSRRSAVDCVPTTSSYLEDDTGPKPAELYGKFTWKIDNFSEISKRELRSTVFEVGNYKWYILVYPQGCDVCNHLSLFLCVADYDKLLPGWSHFAQFTIAVVNKDPKKSKYSDTLHRFCKKEHDWGWKKFMELNKVLEGFTVADTLVIKAQVQVIRDRPGAPFRCLDPQYRRELVRVYLTNVEGICRRFVEEKRDALQRLRDSGPSFRAFWAATSPKQRQALLREKADVILKGIVKRFFNEKEVTSTLVMDALYSGCRQTEETSSHFLSGKHKGSMVQVVIDAARGNFNLNGDAMSLLEQGALETISPVRDDKASDTLAVRNAAEGEDYSRDSVERDERRLAELGRRAVEMFVMAHIFLDRLKAAHSEAESIKRQDALIREEEEEERIEDERAAARSATEKEKKARKKERRQQKLAAEREKLEAEEAEAARIEAEKRAEQDKKEQEALERRRVEEEVRERERQAALAEAAKRHQAELAVAAKAAKAKAAKAKQAAAAASDSAGSSGRGKAGPAGAPAAQSSTRSESSSAGSTPKAAASAAAAVAAARPRQQETAMDDETTTPSSSDEDMAALQQQVRALEVQGRARDAVSQRIAASTAAAASAPDHQRSASLASYGTTPEPSSAYSSGGGSSRAGSQDLSLAEAAGQLAQRSGSQGLPGPAPRPASREGSEAETDSNGSLSHHSAAGSSGPHALARPGSYPSMQGPHHGLAGRASAPAALRAPMANGGTAVPPPLRQEAAQATASGRGPPAKQPTSPSPKEQQAAVAAATAAAAAALRAGGHAEATRELPSTASAPPSTSSSGGAGGRGGGRTQQQPAQPQVQAHPPHQHQQPAQQQQQHAQQPLPPPPPAQPLHAPQPSGNYAQPPQHRQSQQQQHLHQTHQQQHCSEMAAAAGSRGAPAANQPPAPPQQGSSLKSRPLNGGASAYIPATASSAPPTSGALQPAHSGANGLGLGYAATPNGVLSYRGSIEAQRMGSAGPIAAPSPPLNARMAQASAAAQGLGPDPAGLAASPMHSVGSVGSIGNGDAGFGQFMAPPPHRPQLQAPAMGPFASPLSQKRVDHVSNVESPGLDDFAHMGLITDLLD